MDPREGSSLHPTNLTNLGHQTLSPTCSAGGVSGGAASLDVNSNGMFSVETPEAKGSITSKSELNYPVIDNHGRIHVSEQNRKLVRFVTVIAYIFSVSLAAIVLSFYYFFLWDPHMEGRVVTDGMFTNMGPLTPPPLGMETYRSGRKRVKTIPMPQHNINHFPLEATSYRLPQPSIDSMTFPVPTAKPDCDKKNSLQSPASLVDSQGLDYESTDNDSPPFQSTPPPTNIVGRLTRSDYQSFDAHASPLTAKKDDSTTDSSNLYDLILRRFTNIKMTSPKDSRDASSSRKFIQ